MARYTKDGQKKPDINSKGRLTRLARSGMEPGERAAKQRALDKAGTEAARNGREIPEEANPVVVQHQLLKEARLQRLREEGEKFKEGADKMAPKEKVMAVIGMISCGHTGPEACDALGISLYSYYNHLARDPEVKRAADEARLEYAHARVADMYRRVEEEPDPQKARIYADIVKWEVSKVLPKFYGDRIDVTSNGEGIRFNIGIPPKPAERVINEVSNAEEVRQGD